MVVRHDVSTRQTYEGFGGNLQSGVWRRVNQEFGGQQWFATHRPSWRMQHVLRLLYLPWERVYNLAWSQRVDTTENFTVQNALCSTPGSIGCLVLVSSHQNMLFSRGGQRVRMCTLGVFETARTIENLVKLPRSTGRRWHNENTKRSHNHKYTMGAI